MPQTINNLENAVNKKKRLLKKSNERAFK